MIKYATPDTKPVTHSRYGQVTSSALRACCVQYLLLLLLLLLRLLPLTDCRIIPGITMTTYVTPKQGYSPVTVSPQACVDDEVRHARCKAGHPQQVRPGHFQRTQQRVPTAGAVTTFVLGRYSKRYLQMAAKQAFVLADRGYASRVKAACHLQRTDSRRIEIFQRCLLWCHERNCQTLPHNRHTSTTMTPKSIHTQTPAGLMTSFGQLPIAYLKGKELLEEPVLSHEHLPDGLDVVGADPHPHLAAAPHLKMTGN
jgi:hypothetical protein